MPFSARTEAMCPVCNQLILPGEITRPLTGNTSGSLSWSHLHCVNADDEIVPMCKHWITRGSCLYMETCLFRHPASSRGNVATPEKRNGSRRRLRVFNEGRAGAVRRWLLRVFGEEYLRSGSGVLEVAGGKGELSFELCNLNAVSTCVFDPRPLDLERFKKKLVGGYYHKNDVLSVFNTVVSPPLSVDEVQEPAHIRGMFEMHIDRSRSLSSSSASPVVLSSQRALSLPLILKDVAAFRVGLDIGRTLSWTSKGLEHETLDDAIDPLESLDSAIDPSEVDVRVVGSDAAASHEDGIAAVSPEELEVARDRVANCSVVVGLHPDQATEHILRFSIENNKPCVIVPCCVYGRQFPKRFTRIGKPVRQYGDLMEYLLSLLSFCVPCTPASAEISSNGVLPEAAAPVPCSLTFGTVQMDFDGKNLMLFYLADMEPRRSPYAVESQICRGPAGPEHWWNLTDGHSS